MDSELTTFSPKPLNEWESGSGTLEMKCPDGNQVNLVFAPYVRRADNILHSRLEQNGIYYDVPSDGDYNLMLYSHEDNQLIPLAAASIKLENDLPTVTMIQRVNTSIKASNSPQSKTNSRFQINAFYDRISHPKIDLLQGKNQIEWQQTLLEQCQTVVKNQGYKKMRLLSGFVSKYFSAHYNLPLALQQYDCLVSNSPDWSPVDEQGIKITDNGQRQQITQLIRQVRNRKIKSVSQLKQSHPYAQLPRYWEKDL